MLIGINIDIQIFLKFYPFLLYYKLFSARNLKTGMLTCNIRNKELVNMTSTSSLFQKSISFLSSLGFLDIRDSYDLLLPIVRLFLYKKI